MKKNILKQEFVKMPDCRYAKVEIQKTTYSGFNFEVVYKDGTSSGSRFFHDATQANDFFEQKLKEYKE